MHLRQLLGPFRIRFTSIVKAMLGTWIDDHAHVGGAKFYRIINPFFAITVCVERVVATMQDVQWRIGDIGAGTDVAKGIV